jgi:flagellar biosynthetic protein FliP
MTNSTLSSSTTATLHRHGRGRVIRHVVTHYLEMVVAMVVGMVALGPVWNAAWPGLSGHVAAESLVMATDMAIGMGAWMRFRGHSWSAIAVMSAAMYLPFLVLLVPYWLGAITGGTLMGAGHILMLPAMALAMLWRRSEYLH